MLILNNLLKKIHNNGVEGVSPSPNYSYTPNYQKHEPSGYCLYEKSNIPDIINIKPIIYSRQSENNDVAISFVNTLEKNTKEIYQEYFKFPTKINKLTKEELNSFKNATHCYICNEGVEGDFTFVKDHCHFTGKYRGPAHTKSNLLVRKPKFIPVVYHNLQNYDAYLFIK